MSMVYGSSAANPEQLQVAGVAFQKASNMFYGLASSKDLQGGGQLEIGVLDLFSSEAEMRGHLGQEAEQITQHFLGVVIDAGFQMADAAMDLFQCANDFKTADGYLTTKNIAGLTPAGTDDGMQVYTSSADGTFYKDKDGDILHVYGGRSGDAGTGQNGEYVDQRYEPPT